MFCPSCGLEDRQSNQFCRACGADLRSVRFALERPDKITASANSAREEIGRVFAQRIGETDDATEMKIIAEDVLPQIEKFLESPEEKRLRRVRAGTIISLIGLGVTIAFIVASVIINDPKIVQLAAAGLITFFIGLSFVINGLLFTVPKKSLADKSVEADRQRTTDSIAAPTGDLILPESNQIFASVTEHTTRHLKEQKPIPRS